MTTPEQFRRPLLLQYRLLACTKDKARLIVDKSGQQCGFESWKLLHLKYEPGQGAKKALILDRILNPKFDEKTSSTASTGGNHKWPSMQNMEEHYQMK